MLLKSWFPRLFGSSHPTPNYQNGGHSKNSRYAHMGGSGSRPYTGPKTFRSTGTGGGGSKRSGELPENDSKEAIMMPGNRIVRKTEFTMEIED